MVYVGIDFSMNSTGICVLKDDKHIFYNINRGSILKRTVAAYEGSDDIHIVMLDKSKNMNDYNLNENAKLELAEETAQTILEILQDFNDDMEIAIEGFSYGGKGLRMLDLAGYNYALRVKLLNSGFVKKLHFFSPSTIKKHAIKGNASKEMMVDSYLELNVENSLTILGNQLKPSGDVYKAPYTDLVDAFFIVDFLKNNELT